MYNDTLKTLILKSKGQNQITINSLNYRKFTIHKYVEIFYKKIA